MYSLSLDSNELIDIVKSKMRHPYVERYIQTPFIDNEKISVLHDLYDQLELPVSIKKQSITTIMLVQIALDTHEVIPANEPTWMTETEKQLSVLAGDYYSGLYYLLLAETEDIKMIRLLANAIKQINEHKMTLYYEDVSSFNELIEEMKQIESLLFTEVADYLGYDQGIVQVISEVLLLNKLHTEITKIKDNKHSYIKQFVRNNSIADDALSMITEEIARRKHILDELLSQLPYPYHMKNYIKEDYKLSYNTTMAEEG